MDPITLAAIMAAMYGAKSMMVDVPAAEKKRQLRAKEIYYSPFSGIKNFTDVPDTDTLGSMIGGGMQGYGLGQGIAGADQQKAQNAEVLKIMQKMAEKDDKEADTTGPTQYNEWLKNKDKTPAVAYNDPATNMWGTWMNNFGG